MIYTFYSYKGGVGRSMALANVAELFYQAGLKVLMVDWDLEAPGLERFFPVNHDEVYNQRGLMDMLLSYKQQMKEEFDFSDNTSERIKSLPFENPEQLLFDIYPHDESSGKLWLLSAGKRSKENFIQYANQVRNFDWGDFYQNWEGELYFEWLRQKFEKIADVVLIDSRTGVTEMGGVCSYQLADVIVMLCSTNQQSLEGTHKMLLDFKRPEVAKIRDRSLDVIVVPARVENAESEYLADFQEEFNKLFSEHTPEKLSSQTDALWQLCIPYIPRYAYKEFLAIPDRDKPYALQLVEAFSKLAASLSLFAKQDSSIKKAIPESKITIGKETFSATVVNQSVIVTGNNNVNVINKSIDHLFKASKPIKKTNTQEKEPCNLPRKSYQGFVGRKEEIVELLNRISPEYRQHINVVRGIGGVGKTALVLEVAYKCWAAKKNGSNEQDIPIFDAIIFTSSKATDMVNTQIISRPEKEPLLTDIFRVISDVLNEPTITQIRQSEQAKKVKEVLSKQATLLIVDNMETLSEKDRNLILSFLNDVPKSTQVIITTRDFLGFDSISINSLTKSESFDLLTHQARIKDIPITSKWKKLVYDHFGGIPIALIYAVGKRAAGYEFAYITEQKVAIADLGKFCFESSVVHIKETKAYKLLMSMTFFQKPPCREALISVAGLTDGNQDVIDGLAKLQQLSLIVEEEKGRYSILSLTREYAILELEILSNADFKRAARKCWYNWYLDFTQQYGGLDWEGWRARYDRLDAEWENIELVLNWYAEKAEWAQVLRIWENVDNYADLSGYWQDRRYWWALLGKYVGSTKIQVKALSEKGFTLTLMGTEYYQEAEAYLTRAWDLSKDIDKLIQSTVANHLAVLDTVKVDYDRAQYWLSIEESLLKEYPFQTDTDKEKKRYEIRNLYYKAEVNYLQNNIDLAKDQFEKTIDLTREIGWQRFRNYAKNYLVEIYLKKNDLESAERTLRIGIESAIQAKETRRIALYHASYARLYYQLALNVKQEILDEKLDSSYIGEAKNYANRAMKVFSKEFMINEKNEINELMRLINEYCHDIQ
jgi:cellulose biosynthesis protein BcsQ